MDTPAITVPVTTSLPASITPTELVEIAREVVLGVNSLETILARYSLSAEHFELIKQNEFFKKTHESLAREWEGISNTKERLRVLNMAAYEHVLPSLTKSIQNEREDLSHRVAGAKLLAEGGELITKGGPGSGGSSGERVSITINLGADVGTDQTVTFEGTLAPQHEDVPTLPEGKGSPPALRAITKRAPALEDLFRVPEGET